MRVLIDTQVFLWWIEDSPRLSRKAARTIADPENEILLSLASCWEVAIKVSSSKLRLPQPPSLFFPEQLQRNGFDLLDIAFPHVAGVTDLPFHHRDPFDRLIISQALTEKIPVLTSDRIFAAYGVTRIWR